MPRSSRTFLGLLAAAAMLLFGILCVRPALAANYDYTDIWYTPTPPEAGWGVNFAQSDNFIFATFFIYGADKKPTWYTAQLTWDGTSQFTGGLYATQGSYFGGPWIPAEHPDATLVGTASFIPSTVNNYQGTLNYTVTGVAPVSKAIQRQTLTPILLTANYIGGQTGTLSGCTSSSNNGSYDDYARIQVTQPGSGVKMLFTFINGGQALSCTLAGTLTQNGQLYSVNNATYVCSGAFTLNTTASITDLKATALGIEGQFTALSSLDGCREDAHFSATLN